MMTINSFAHLSDDRLIVEVKTLATNERRATADLIASLAELDARRLYLGEGCSSLFTYCTQVLRLSEHAAYGRIQAARTARRFPVIVDLLACAAINLTTVGLLSAHLTQENHREVLAAATHKTKREVECLVARISPQPAAQDSIRKHPAPVARRTSNQGAARATQSLMDTTLIGGSVKPPIHIAPLQKPPVVSPLAPERFKVQFTITRDTHEKLRRVQDLMRPANPSGDPAVVFDRALTLLLAELEKHKLAKTDRPRAARPTKPGSRHIPSAVKRNVWARDGGQCAFRGTNGRCAETGFLEYHHVVPFADGGAAVAANIQLRCRAHNAYESEQLFGPWTPMSVRERACAGGYLRLGPDQAGVASGAP